MMQIQDNIIAKEQQLSLQESKVAEELRHLHTLTDIFSADFMAAQSTISQKLSASLQEVEQGQRNLQAEWIALIEQQQALGIREQRLQHVITTRMTMQLSNRLKRLLLNAKARSWRVWMFHIHRRLYKRFKFHAAFKLRCRRILGAAFTQWHSRVHVDFANKFQNLARDREAQLLEKSSELQMLHSASVQREMQLQHDLAEALSFAEQQTQRAEKLEKTVTLQDVYIVQYEQQNHQLQLLRDIQQKQLRDEAEAHAAAEEHRAKYRRSEVAGRVVKRFRNLTMSKAFATWIDCVRDAREELLVDYLERLQNGVTSLETLLKEKEEQQQSLRQQLQQKQNEVEVIKVQHAAAEEHLLKTINELQTIVEGARVERSEMVEMISLLEISLQKQTTEQQQLFLETQSGAQKPDVDLQQNYLEHEQLLTSSAKKLERLNLEQTSSAISDDSYSPARQIRRTHQQLPLPRSGRSPKHTT
jgi:hypothetical protein